MGDLAEVGQSYIHWNNWFDAAKDVISTIPIMPVQGNHETYTMSRRKHSKPIYFTSQFKVFQNGPNGLKGQVYSFDYGTIHFSVLDSQQDEEEPINGDILSMQKEWLDRDLASTKKPWKLVLMHKPPYFNNPRSMNIAVKAAFCPVFDKHHVDVVFTAHDHIIARTFPYKNDKKYSNPKDGTVYYITGRSGAKHYDLLFSMPWDEFFYSPRKQPCYLSVSVNKNSLNIAIYNQDGSAIDSYAIVK
jgi:3',5'-cyclic AMP phosphodiesterase CpdA